jgi:hypothetical protein
VFRGDVAAIPPPPQEITMKIKTKVRAGGRCGASTTKDA